MSLDLFPTVVTMAQGPLSPARKYYGADLTPLLAGDESRLTGPGLDGARELLGYYAGAAVSLRSGPWKFLRPGYWDLVDTLYNLQTDPAEVTDVYPARPDVAKALEARLAAIAHEISQGAKRPKKGGTGAN